MKNCIVMTFALVMTLIAGGAAAADFKVVVNGSNPVDSISKEKLTDIFLKKLTRWDNGHAVTPVDQAERNAVRDRFTRGALNKEVSWVEGYWQKMIFSGRATPPARLASDAEVIDFVRGNPDAIGYVADATPLGSGIKTLTVKD